MGKKYSYKKDIVWLVTAGVAVALFMGGCSNTQPQPKVVVKKTVIEKKKIIYDDNVRKAVALLIEKVKMIELRQKHLESYKQDIDAIKQKINSIKSSNIDTDQIRKLNKRIDLLHRRINNINSSSKTETMEKYKKTPYDKTIMEFVKDKK